MLKNNTSTRRVIFAALMLALSIVLAHIVTIPIFAAGTKSLIASLANIPIVVAAIVLGPVYGAVSCGLSDFYRATFIGGFGYDPLFTVSAIIYGAIIGIFFRDSSRAPKITRVYVATLAAEIIASTIINTLFINYRYGTPIPVLLTTRVWSLIIDPIVNTFFAMAIIKIGMRTDILKSDFNK